jgi:hypothetical protein
MAVVLGHFQKKMMRGKRIRERIPAYEKQTGA